MEYLHSLRQQLTEAHDFARRHQDQAGQKQKKAYDVRCRGWPFSSGEKVWVYNPIQKKGVSPKLTTKWGPPCEVLEQLSDVVYRVRMSVRGWVVVLHQDRLASYRPYAEPADIDNAPCSPGAPPLPSTSAPCVAGGEMDSRGQGPARRKTRRRQRRPPRRYVDCVLSL